MSFQLPIKHESVSIDGKLIYYEKYGKGFPLFLLHGYSQSSKSWKSYINDFHNDHEVYLVDLTGHGKSEPFKNDLSLKSVANDLNLLIEYLRLDRINAIGFSFGGDILYQLALINPTIINSMITIGAVGTWTINNFPDYLKSYTYENRDNFPWLKTSHDGEEHIRNIMNQFKNYTIEMSNSDLQSIKSNVLVVLGDNDDGIDLKEAVRVKRYVPNANLWVLPNVSHGAHEGKNKEEFIAKSKLFLKSKS